MESLVPLARAVAELLIARGERIAVAESSAGGLINAALVAVPGASAYYLGGSVIYTLAGREGLLSISTEDMAGMRSASEPFARLLAERARTRLGAQWGLSETGASGPTGNRYGDAAGHACIAVSGQVPRVLTVETGSTDRVANMYAFATAALELLGACLREA